MGLLRRTCYDLGIVLLTLALGGCNNGAPLTPFRSVQENARGNSPANGSALMYVSDPATNTVAMYSYPGLKLRGKIFGLKRPTGLCVDASTGNVWVTWGTTVDKVSEFPHGGTTRIRTLKINGAPAVDACAVDPTRGNLAVVQSNDYDDSGSILLFKNGGGKPKSYYGPMFDLRFIGYDNAGNAFVDGTYQRTSLEELAPKAKRATDVTPKGMRLHSAGGVQYDGSYIAVGVAKRGIIYQTLDRTITGTTKLSGACLVQQFFIDGSVVIAPNVCNSTGDVLFYNYPAGGTPVRKLSGFSRPYAVVVSK
jgi:hypothetical protein